ncbi:ABC transporter ATP-binding protein [Actinomyces sp. HMT897]|uniref:dipeptide ABC transporter ATP-binding protein n=1 Tax=Actinomyces sp. HMT897 TaxID=2789424 RepID=UPI0019094FA4|nr:ABC transporter ATP-binding protein [Actinomyces sp. HMT897]QQO77119.1 ABC transporter ATP-binding protein [Actinomyces sp. HMT897]
MGRGTGAPALSLRGLGVTFAGASAPASADVDLDLVPGRVLALVGESGSGKSVTAMGALGLLAPTAHVTGSAVLYGPGSPGSAGYGHQDPSGSGAGRGAGTELVGAPRHVLDDVRGRLVGTVFQELATALDPLGTIASQIGEAVRAHTRATRHQVGQRVRSLLGRVGLGAGEQVERIARSYPHQLSGGQLQRACIALAMACDPPVLVADEPTTALDVTVQAGILDLLRSLTKEGTAVLLITHDMGVVADVADTVVVMRHGRVVERGGVRQLFASPRHPYTRELLAAVPRLDSLRQEGPGAAARAPRPVVSAGCQVRSPGSGPASGSGSGSVSGSGPSPAPEPLVRVRDLDVVYRSGRRRVHAVRGVSLSIAPGEVLGLVGESGSGKSTLAGTLTGLVPVAAGSVRVGGTEVAGARRRVLAPVRRTTGVVYQDPASSLNPRRRVGASVAEPLVVHGGYDAAARRARVRELLEAVRLPAAYAQRYPHEMSGGQRQRVAIARALALGPRLVVADEPTSALDVSVQAVVLDLLRHLQQELGFACLFVSHDLAVVDAVAGRTVVLQAGRVVEEGATAQVLAAPRQEYTRRLVAAVPLPDPVLQAGRRERRLAATR